MEVGARVKNNAGYGFSLAPLARYALLRASSAPFASRAPQPPARTGAFAAGAPRSASYGAISASYQASHGGGASYAHGTGAGGLMGGGWLVPPPPPPPPDPFASLVASSVHDVRSRQTST